MKKNRGLLIQWLKLSQFRPPMIRGGRDDSWKVFPLRKLGPTEHDKYANYILQKTQVISILTNWYTRFCDYSARKRQFLIFRYRCLKLVKSDADNFLTYSVIVNRECERFKLGWLTEDQFKSLIFTCIHSCNPRRMQKSVLDYSAASSRDHQ
ncbi:hypothetical protein T265_04121 [Opisthorchis viverrini]|uniref:Uncharacterized protein n=1 Tax=Opisthorchis viverrini TaxID=6198 RepID=A0A074ZTR8_OPIVI|nr:hypothetical protein T265_04121 [Opisthorchis viverrini]KER29187.1 hypothetical protein T265_04121 [Opisthorchis viverrini]